MIFNIQKVGQVQFLQWHHLMANVKIYKHNFLHFLFSPRYDICERVYNTHTHTHTHVRTRMHTCARAHALMHTHTHTHTHTDTNGQDHWYIRNMADLPTIKKIYTSKFLLVTSEKRVGSVVATNLFQTLTNKVLYSNISILVFEY